MELRHTTRTTTTVADSMDFLDHIRLSAKEMSRISVSEQAVVVETHCLYPSFERVKVTVEKSADGYWVRDDFGAFDCAWKHGQNKKAIERQVALAAAKFHADARDGEISVKAKDISWVPSAILAVANGSAMAANVSVSKLVKSTEKLIRDTMKTAFASPHYRHFHVASDVEIKGGSGKLYNFDFRLKSRTSDKQMIFAGISAHHSSISHRYTAFADILNGEASLGDNFAVFEENPPNEEKILMQQVAAFVPVSSLSRLAEQSGY